MRAQIKKRLRKKNGMKNVFSACLLLLSSMLSDHYYVCVYVSRFPSYRSACINRKTRWRKIVCSSAMSICTQTNLLNDKRLNWMKKFKIEHIYNQIIEKFFFLLEWIITTSVDLIKKISRKKKNSLCFDVLSARIDVLLLLSDSIK